MSSAQQNATSSREQSKKNAACSDVHMQQLLPRRLPYVLQALNAWGERPFAYGTADCCQFVAHVAKYLTGKDYAAGFNYSTWAESERLLAASGGLCGLLSGVLGDPVPKARLIPGDVALWRRGSLEAATVYLGTGNVAALTIRGGIEALSDRRVRWGWRI